MVGGSTYIRLLVDGLFIEDDLFVQLVKTLQETYPDAASVMASVDGRWQHVCKVVSRRSLYRGRHLCPAHADPAGDVPGCGNAEC